MSNPPLIVISGPSGSGKTTLVKMLLRDPAYRRAITATTRAPRPGEKDGVAYHFRTKEALASERDRGGLVEWAVVHGEWYGTPKSEVTPVPGRMTLLDVDVQGFRSVKSLGIPCLSVFIAPPNLDALRQRLEHRGTETSEQLARRLARAEVEMQAQGEYDKVVINNDLDQAFHELRALTLAGTSTEGSRKTQ